DGLYLSRRRSRHLRGRSAQLRLRSERQAASLLAWELRPRGRRRGYRLNGPGLFRITVGRIVPAAGVAYMGMGYVLLGVAVAVEDELQLSRRYYNGAVRNLNTMIESFPSNLIANAFHFEKAEFFDLGDDAARQAPRIELGR